MKQMYTLKLLAIGIIIGMATPQNSSAQYLVSSEQIDESTPLLISLLTGLPAQYTVRTYRVTYNTVDTQGEPTVASGAVSVPVGANCTELPMLVYCHGTVLRQLDVPSQNNFESLVGKAFGSTGFIAVAPDYLGLGLNPGIHPYVHGESQATASIDLVYAAREFVETIDDVTDSGELFITGYSQGGHAAMATLKYAQENNLNESLGIVAGAPCSGPYNLSGSQAEVLLSDQPYSNPGYIVYLLIGYQLVYGNIYQDLGDIIQSPYNETVLPFFDGAQNESDMDEVNAILPGELSALLVDTVLTNFESNENHPIWVALRDNDNFDWAPEVPLRLYYCDGDEQVPFTNSTFAETVMNDNGAEDVLSLNVSPGANHGGCILPALSEAFDFFANLASPCVTSNVDNAIAFKNLELAPNPAQNFVRLSFPESSTNVTVYDISGRVILERSNVQSGVQIDISSLRSGAYIVLATSGDTYYRAKMIIE
jgi:pimeloyl-ACP methyl ester carboxylesterase